MKLGTPPIINQSEKCLKLNFFLKGHDLLKIVIVLFCILLAVQTLPPFPIFTEGRRGLYTGYILTVTDTAVSYTHLTLPTKRIV